MTRPFVPLLATGVVIAAVAWCGAAAAQQPPTAAPEPKMPPMPSMEGQQGDVSKPVTQIPPAQEACGGREEKPRERDACRATAQEALKERQRKGRLAAAERPKAENGSAAYLPVGSAAPPAGFALLASSFLRSSSAFF